MSNTNNVEISYIKEVTYGVTPTNPTMQAIRHKGESLKADTTFVKSEEIVSDRQVTDIIRTDFKTGGDIMNEWSYAQHEAFMGSALQSAAFTTAATVTGVIYSAASADNSFNRSSGDFAASQIFLVYHWIKVSGFVTAANNGYFRIDSVATLKLIVSGGSALVNEAAGPSVTITMGQQLKNGTTLDSYTLRKKFTDVTLYEILGGSCIDSWSAKCSVGDKINGSFGFMGKSASSTDILGSGSVTAAPTNAVMEAVDHVPLIYENGTTYQMTEFSFDLKNNLRSRQVVGTLGPISMGSGTLNITGNLNAYFSSAAIMDKYLAATASGIATMFRDSSSRGYIIDLPSIRYTSGGRVAGGQDADVMAELAWEAFRDPIRLFTMSINKFAS